ncbi:MAG: peptidase [Candidatus Eremiobacteraeota bacterium]|nr:peptidase [Candidatus Eremiobacteraeota bacterium]
MEAYPEQVSLSGYVRTPTIADDRIVFACEDDLWIVGVQGGIARRLTTMAGECSLPRLSPDGTRLAFVGRDEGHSELYVMPSEGGVPRRLTYLGSEALYCSGWSRDGRSVYFTSDAGSPFVRETLAFRVDADGGEPVALGFGHATTIDVAENGATLLGRNAIDPARWKRYRGGTAGHLWVDVAGTGDFKRICRDVNGNLVWPMWLGERVLFLSDHEGVGNLYSVLPDGTDLRRHTEESEHYVRFPASDGTRVVYACGGELAVLDPRDRSVRRVPVEMPSSAPETARRFVDAAELLERWGSSHDGTSLGIVSRGRAYVMPLWEEAVTEIGTAGGVRRRLLTWLHDDKRVAYVDDASGYERIAVAPLDQSAAAEYVTHDDAGVLHELVASPAGDRLAFATNRHELWLVDIGSAPRKLDTSIGERIDDLAFSPDGAWLAYVWSAKAHTTIVRLVECATGRLVDATTALREDRSPAWDPEGKYLYFISTRDFHPVYDALQFELSFPEASRPYLVTLRADLTNPFIPKPAALHKAHDDDDEKDDDDKKDAKPPVVIDADGLPLRMIAFPVEEGAYDRIAGAKGRAIFSRFPVRGIQPNVHHDEESEGELQAYDFEEQRSASLAGEIDDFVLGPDARTLVYASHGKLRAIDAGGDLPEDGGEDDKPSQDPGRRSGWLDLGRISVLVEPTLEWRQMLREAWRLQRENFWDPQMSGIDWDGVLRRYESLLPLVRTRNELSDVIWEMQGELGTSHAYETGGDKPIPPQYKRGFLGAELSWTDEPAGYRIDAILRGDPWNREVDSPLAEAGVDLKPGDTIVAIGGRPVSAQTGPGALLVNQAGRDIVLTVVRAGEPPRRVLVRTLRDERMLRYRAWVDANRARVHGHSGGRIGYVHIPDMGPWGFAEFHRGYLSEFDRDALVVDVRFNRGGHVSALLLEKLARKRVGYDVSRWSPPFPYPEESVAGPIVAVTNQFAGSDGDIFSHCFKLYGLGPLVGMRTWGGVIGIHPRHRLVDGTETTQPEFSFWFTDAGWGVENYGTDPTHEVDVSPQDVLRGVDPQLDVALRLVDEALALHPPRPTFPPRPNRAMRR